MCWFYPQIWEMEQLLFKIWLGKFLYITNTTRLNMGLLSRIRSRWLNIFSGESSPGNIGIYGPPNGGKTTLTNRIVSESTDKEDIADLKGSASSVAHETREAEKREQIPIEHDGDRVVIDIVDTPGISTKVDYKEFLDDENFDGSEEEARDRSREATKGVQDAIKWLKNDVDGVIYVIDSTEDPYTQVNTMIRGVISAESIPAVVLANKIDRDDSNVQRVENAFPDYEVIPVSALEGDNMENVYEAIATELGGN
jgi:GTPase Era involved in 16S rRNA processing